MEKLKFHFKVQGKDEKTNVITITSIETGDGKVFKIPEELQHASHHKEVTQTNAYAKIKNSLKKRHQERKIWIQLTDEIKKIYVDEAGNIQFLDQFLEEIDEINIQTSDTESGNVSTLNKILEKLIENTQASGNQNLKTISEKFVIEKFTSKNPNADQWIEIFEKECERFNVTEDEKKIEVLRLFMDGSCKDWYSSMLIKLTTNATWDEWKKKFCDTFTNKGWNAITYALLFKYKDGSLLDYAMRKEKLLIDMRNSIDQGTLIDLIAVGLPEFILNKIDRKTIKETVDLFNEISRYEHMVNRKGANKKSNIYTENKGRNEKKPCANCENLNKGIRYHAEETCWFKKGQDDRRKGNIRHVNNSVIETELNDTYQKNE